MSVNLSAHTCFVSSNVFKNCVLVMIPSHINCTLFLHRSKVHTFLSVSLNCLHEMIQSNTGCICLTFLHCVFSASSNRLHPPLCVFKRVLNEGAKSHWLHLFDFSPLCPCTCVLKVPAPKYLFVVSPPSVPIGSVLTLHWV